MASLPVPDLDVAALLTRLGAKPRRITADSRQVQPGDAFAAFPGTHTDGRNFIPDALAGGGQPIAGPGQPPTKGASAKLALTSAATALPRSTRPLARRAVMIARPARVRIRSRNPCVFARRRLFGWKVRLLTRGLQK